jgi:hypothetical protein
MGIVLKCFNWSESWVAAGLRPGAQVIKDFAFQLGSSPVRDRSKDWNPGTLKQELFRSNRFGIFPYFLLD